MAIFDLRGQAEPDEAYSLFYLYTHFGGLSRIIRDVVYHLTNEETFRDNINIFSFHFVQKHPEGKSGER